jgi:hypothetical protein
MRRACCSTDYVEHVDDYHLHRPIGLPASIGIRSSTFQGTFSLSTTWGYAYDRSITGSASASLDGVLRVSRAHLIALKSSETDPSGMILAAFESFPGLVAFRFILGAFEASIAPT